MRAEAPPTYTAHNSQTECGGTVHENDNRMFQKGKKQSIQLIAPSFLEHAVSWQRGANGYDMREEWGILRESNLSSH